MAVSLDYAIEKYRETCHTLATLPDSIHDRLVTAYVSEGTHAWPAGPEIPTAIAEGIDALHGRLTANGSFDATVGAMTADEACACADEIWSIYFDLRVARDYPNG